MFFVYLLHTFYSHRKNVKFDLRPVSLAANNLFWYAVELTKKTISIRNDGHRQFD